ncbi:MAG: lipoyl(octanoyl) transferase LipB [Planctomycetota bacterium]
MCDAQGLTFEISDLGRMSYADAYAEQERHHAEVLAARDAGGALAGRVLTVVHDPVITVSRRRGAANHVLLPPEMLAERGITLEATDRGGDVTYHGPGQLVVYPILDLKRLRLRLHEYMRLLEQSVIDGVAGFGVEGFRDPDATGVWVAGRSAQADERSPGVPPAAKICAMGVRVRRWISMHGLALNVHTDLEHFGLIVPCGLAGRPVTSLAAQLGPSVSPSVDEVRAALLPALVQRLQDHQRIARDAEA